MMDVDAFLEVYYLFLSGLTLVYSVKYNSRQLSEFQDSSS